MGTSRMSNQDAIIIHLARSALHSATFHGMAIALCTHGSTAAGLVALKLPPSQAPTHLGCVHIKQARKCAHARQTVYRNKLLAVEALEFQSGSHVSVYVLGQMSDQRPCSATRKDMCRAGRSSHQCHSPINRHPCGCFHLLQRLSPTAALACEPTVHKGTPAQVFHIHVNHASTADCGR